MPPSSRPPETQARVKTFDPLELDRSVIAIPLLRQMEAELRQIQTFLTEHPLDRQEFNSVIEYNREYSGKPEEMRQLVVEMAERAASKALEVSKKRVEDSKEAAPVGTQVSDGTAGDRADIYGNMFLMEQRRHAALEEAIGVQKIGLVSEDGSYSFANLHASIIRRLLAANDRLSAPDEVVNKPIIQIHPTRYDVIIDLNLEYPGGREEARQWVYKNIEVAKEKANVRDAGQDVHLKKYQRESGYVFARMEARVIKALIELDIDAAKSKASEAEAKIHEARPGNLTGAAKIDPGKFRAIFRIWPDFEISASINKSIATIKADAAQNSFSARGAGITWAVMDSGIKHDHEHFHKHANIDKDSEWHKDFTVDGGGPFEDENGHGTHVAGIIAGEWRPATAASVVIEAPASTDVSRPTEAPVVMPRIPIASFPLFKNGFRRRRISTDKTCGRHKRHGAAL